MSIFGSEVKMMKDTVEKIAKCRSGGGRLQLQRKQPGKGRGFRQENTKVRYVCLWCTVAGLLRKKEEMGALAW